MKIAKILTAIACVFALSFMAIGYALIQDELEIGGSISVNGEPLLADKTFVFESNYLKAGDTPPTYTVYGNTVDILLFNHDGLDVTGSSLTYEITCTEGAAFADGATTLKNNTLEAGGTGTYRAHTLTYTGSGNGTVTVTAKASSPSTKTVSAIFQFVETSGYYTVTDGKSYVQIDVYTDDAVSGIAVTGTEGLIPDTTNPNFNGQSIGALPADSHYTFVYFKTSDASYAPVEKTALTDTIILKEATGS